MRSLVLFGLLCSGSLAVGQEDHVRRAQTAAIEKDVAEWGHWGYLPEKYTQWGTHSNRLIPVYTFGTLGAGAGVDLTSYQGENSPYRDAKKLRAIYGRLPSDTLNPAAEYLDQTNVYDLQVAGAAAGKKHIFLIVFDGMDWNSTRNAAIYNEQKVSYAEGRGTGTHFQEYQAGGTTQFGFMCTSPHNEGTIVDVDSQTVLNPGGKLFGGYNAKLGGPNPWTPGSDVRYLVAASKNAAERHAYTDSSSSASSMTAGVKIYNNSVNVGPSGELCTTIAHRLQEQGWSVGAVSSVPLSHATPACTYAHNVERDDYQDISRDLVGLPSISHPQTPLPGLDVIVAGGFGTKKEVDAAQGTNFVPGSVYIADPDLKAIDVERGGKYVVAKRTTGVNGAKGLSEAADRAIAGKHRFLGHYGVAAYSGHLPFATADGDFRPTVGRSKTAEKYTRADLDENPDLAQMTEAAIRVLQARGKNFWMLVEAGDVDWGNHDDNIDNSIGAVNSGDRAVKAVTDWVEKHSNWQESLVIVTADHGHYFHLLQPEVLVAPKGESTTTSR